jgi:hypothetical protein
VARRPPQLTWAGISRGVGVFIALVLLFSWLVATFVHVTLDRTVTLAFLGLATTLVGGPSGWQLVRRNGESSK